MEFYGWCVAEPHHCGTPHWHIVLYCEKHQREALTATLQRYWFGTDSGELKNWKAKKARLDVKRVNPRLCATGYILKYISKGIDGYANSTCSYGTEAVSAAARIRAWASCWSVRQFQPLGQPAVTIWRELRRVRGKHQSEAIETARAAADSGEFGEFWDAIEDDGLNIIYETPDGLNGYGETRDKVVAGVTDGQTIALTRETKWVIQLREEAPQAMREGEAAEHLDSWQ